MPDALPQASRRDGEVRIAVALIGIGLVASVVCGRLHPDGVVHADDLSHYLYAKWAWRWPAYLLDDWGRPGCTGVLFLPAGISWNACRAVSAVLSAAAAWLAFRIAAGLRMPHAWAVIPLTYVQPLFFQLSQTTLTETPLAFYLALAVRLAQRGQWALSCAALSPALVTRHEAVLFVPVWFLCAWQERRPRPGGVAGISGFRWGSLAWLLWAPLVVNGAAWIAGLTPAVMRLLAPRPSSQYGQGGLLTFFSRSMEAWGPGVTVLALIGLRGLWRAGSAGRLMVLCIAAWFGGHTIIRALGLFDSGGYARFLVPVSPLVAIAALAGCRRLFEADPPARRRAALAAAAAMLLLWVAAERQLVLHLAGVDEAAELPDLYRAKVAVRICAAVLAAIGIGAWLGGLRSPGRVAARLLPVALLGMIVFAVVALCGPLRPPPEVALIRDALADLRRRGMGDRQVLSACVWVDYVTGTQMPLHQRSVRARLADAPIGAVFAWERQFAASEDHRLPEEVFEASGAFRLVSVSGPLPFREAPYLRIYEKVGPWSPSESPREAGEAAQRRGLRR